MKLRDFLRDQFKRRLEASGCHDCYQNMHPVIAGLIGIALCAGSSMAARIPFVMPWNDAAPGPTDLSSWNQPIGPNDRVTVSTNGHFELRGQRVRFLGMNLTTDAPFQPTNKAEVVAARLAKFGVNCVRFHHMDPSWALNGGLINYAAGNSRSLNPQQLDLLHYFIARLKAHGVYSDVNLLVSREFKKTDGLPAEIESMDWKDRHIVGFFNDTALALHQEYATQLLTTTNRHTGLPLARDPAVAFVEIMNENGMIQKWFEGVLDSMPAVFVSQLQSRWNDWLAGRYTNDAAMLAAWKAIDQPLGTNLVKNGSFTNGVNFWTLEQHNGAAATFSTTNEFNGQPAARIEVTTPGTASWYVQLNQPGLRVTGGQAYTFSFFAKASQPVNLDTSLMQAHADWAALGYAQTVKLTTNWQRFTATFQASNTDTNARPNFGGFATQKVTVWLADVRFQTGGQIGVLPPGASLASRTVPNVLKNSSTNAVTNEAKKDWVRYLTELEGCYWTAMARHVREKCGYPGLIFGTIIANSPPNVQAQLDVIDGHAYWQHPQFPGIPWDSTNWLISNVSMANTLGDGNPLVGLARQRVKGKPFTVTEYQHPSPNYYGAEGPLLIAAYGALQDWDGFWLFDYGRGNDTTGMGYFHGFFDTAQHPTKMANLLLAAALFRRGDVTPAIKEFTMPLPPETELDTIVKLGSAWSVADGGKLGVPANLALISRLSLSVGTNAVGLANPPAAPTGNLLISDTGELKWDLSQAGRGVVTLNAPRTKVVSGFADNTSFDLGEVRLTPGATQLGWCTLGVTLLEGDSFTNGGRALVIAAGQVDNTGMQWKDASKTSVGSQWGGAPVLAEVVPFNLTLPVEPGRLRVSALNALGQRLDELAVAVTNGRASLSVATNAGTLWYELLIAKDTPFDRWRFANFTAQELVNPSLSGEWGLPAPDGVPNLLKYAMGLSPKLQASAPLIAGEIRALAGGQHLVMTFTRAKSATDVLVTPEVSGDLRDWHSGPDYTEEIEVRDQGATERVAVRDRLPLDQAQQRFMRLKVKRLDGGGV